jgi:hypothetical protein
MWKSLFSELVNEAAVQGGFRLVFLRKSENRDKKFFQYTIACVRYNIYGGGNKKVPNAAKNFKGKDIGPDRLHADGIKKRQLRVESMKGAIWMEGNSLREDTLCFLLRKRKGVLSE